MPELLSLILFVVLLLGLHKYAAQLKLVPLTTDENDDWTLPETEINLNKSLPML